MKNSQTYVVRVHRYEDHMEEVDPTKVNAESPAHAAEMATGTQVKELSAEDQHDAIAVVTLDDVDHDSLPRYFGSLKKN